MDRILEKFNIISFLLPEHVTEAAGAFTEKARAQTMQFLFSVCGKSPAEIGLTQYFSQEKFIINNFHAAKISLHLII